MSKRNQEPDKITAAGRALCGQETRKGGRCKMPKGKCRHHPSGHVANGNGGVTWLAKCMGDDCPNGLECSHRLESVSTCELERVLYEESMATLKKSLKNKRSVSDPYIERVTTDLARMNVLIFRIEKSLRGMDLLLSEKAHNTTKISLQPAFLKLQDLIELRRKEYKQLHDLLKSQGRGKEDGNLADLIKSIQQKARDFSREQRSRNTSSKPARSLSGVEGNRERAKSRGN